MNLIFASIGLIFVFFVLAVSVQIMQSILGTVLTFFVISAIIVLFVLKLLKDAGLV